MNKKRVAAGRFVAGLLIALCVLLLCGGSAWQEQAEEMDEKAGVEEDLTKDRAEDAVFTGEENIQEGDMKTIYLAGGCFWGVEKFLEQFSGVISTEVGYANGPDYAPSYQEVCRSSGHAETVKVVYDEEQISLRELLSFYFMVIDPTSVNRQGNDIGIQYRTGIYYTDKEQLPIIEEVYAEEEKKAGASLAVEVMELENFYTAEEYHQKYLDKNPGGYCHIPRSMFILAAKKICLL